MTALAAIPAEREKTHGRWAETARIAVRLKAVVAAEWAARAARGQSEPSAGQLESLDLACTKMARILSGDPAFPDHWRDLSHYLSEEFADAPAAPRTVMRWATDEELRAQRASWVRGEMAIGLDRQEALARDAARRGYTGDICPDCGSFAMVRSGTCQRCDNCGATTGCS